MQAYLVAYLATLVTLLVCDFVWLSTVGNAIYRPRLGDLLLDRPVWWAAAAFYLVYALGVVIFAAAPGLRAQSWPRALMMGVLFGAFAYATYDLTNLATTRGWSSLVAGLDILWGAALSGVAATAGCLVAGRFAA
jgi:uncharacterized membrane protein